MIARWRAAVLLTLSVGACSGQQNPATEPVQECETPEGSSAMWIDADCVDGDFDDPIIDSEASMDQPVAHQRISGHFESSGMRFTIYLPAEEHWQGRFYQTVYPLAGENAPDGSIEVAAAAGAYLVQTNSGGGYRGDAAAAKFARTVAAEHYQSSKRIYGYISGGSGGSYQTIAAMENSVGVWDGGVPFIVGDPSSIPNNFFARALARLVLADKAAQIADAVVPGGSGTPNAGLDEAETQVLQEVTNLGLPVRAWEDSSYVLGQQTPDALLGFIAQVKQMDPTYAGDFWTLPGYLGTEQSALGERVRTARIEVPVRVAALDHSAERTRVTLAGLQAHRYDGLVDITPTGSSDSLTGRLTPGSNTVEIAGLPAPDVIAALNPGATVIVDNSWYVAAVGYPRYQVPRRGGFDAYDQYRYKDGSPRYPQRPLLAGEVISRSVSGGGNHTGAIHGKVIAISNLLDADAFPLHGDWYRRQVQQALGERTDDNFRLWLFDDADHHAPARTPRLIDYTGALETALRAVSAWAEKDEPPAASTRYQVRGGQMVLPASASERGGLQATVALSADGGAVAQVQVGEPVRLQAIIDRPARAEGVAEIAWSTTGDSEFVADPEAPEPGVPAEHIVQYDEPGIYFPAVRVTTQSDESRAAAGVQALGRIRVVVRG